MIRKSETGLWEAEIDGRKYEFQKWGAEDSLKVLSKLARIVAEPIGVVAGGVLAGMKGQEKFTLKALLDLGLDEDVIGKFVQRLMQNLDEDYVLSIVKKLCSENVFCEGAKISFNTHYEDDLLHLFDVVHAGLEVQYGNFTAALLARLGAVVPVKKNHTTPVPTTSTGRSGPPLKRA